MAFSPPRAALGRLLWNQESLAHEHRLIMPSTSFPKRNHFEAITHMEDILQPEVPTPQWPQAVSGSPSQLYSNHNALPCTSLRSTRCTASSSGARSSTPLPRCPCSAVRLAHGSELSFCGQSSVCHLTLSIRPPHGCRWAPGPEVPC